MLKNAQRLTKIRDLRNRLLPDLGDGPALPEEPLPSPNTDALPSHYTEQLNTAIMRRSLAVLLAQAGFQCTNARTYSFPFADLPTRIQQRAVTRWTSLRTWFSSSSASCVAFCISACRNPSPVVTLRYTLPLSLSGRTWHSRHHTGTDPFGVGGDGSEWLPGAAAVLPLVGDAVRQASRGPRGPPRNSR